VLAKLGESSLPQQYRQAGYSFHATSDLLLGNPDLVKATLAFVSRYPLEKFVYNLDDAIQKAWSPRYASLDQAMARLVENQLLVLEEGEKFPSPDYFLTLAERIRKVTLSNSRDRKKLGEEILKKKDLNPILQKTAGATLLTKSEGRKIMQPLLEGEIEFVKQVAEAQPERSYEVFRRWFPEMEKEKAISAPLKELFTSFATGARAKKVALMESWLKEGTPADSENNGDDFWKDFMSMVSLDEALGHQVVVRVFKDLRVKKTSSRSSTNGVYRKNDSGASKRN